MYDLVWSEPMLSLSKKYNISDVGLRKTCIRMSIPMPGQVDLANKRSNRIWELLNRIYSIKSLLNKTLHSKSNELNLEITGKDLPSEVLVGQNYF